MHNERSITIESYQKQKNTSERMLVMFANYLP